MNDHDVLIYASRECREFIKAMKWCQDWCAACLQKGINPTEHPNFQDHYQRLVTNVIEPLEKKWQEVQNEQE